MYKIIVVSKNKGIVSKDELSTFAASLKSSLDAEVEFYTPEFLGTQVTFHDVVEVWLLFEGKKVLGKVFDKMIDKTLDKTLDAFIKWAKERLSSEENKRPKSLSIYDENRKKIKSVILNTKGEIEDNTEEEQLIKPNTPKKSEPFFEKNVERNTQEKATDL